MAQGKVLGIDLGLARIGLAVCDPLRLTVRPVDVLQRKSRNEDFAQLAELVVQEQIEAVVCGLPLNMDGSEGDRARMTRKWAMRLAHALRALVGKPIPVIFWDERLTTYAANQILAERQLDAAEDAVAAAVILQSYLDAAGCNPDEQYGRIDLPAKIPGGSKS